MEKIEALAELLGVDESEITQSEYNEDEYELRLNDSTPIQLTEIVTEKGNHKIFTGNLILKA